MTTKKGATSEVSPTEGMVRTIKGFDKDLSCMGFQFKIGKTYKHSGPVEICRSGFHGVDGNPLRVFEFYRPARSRYTLAEQNGQIKREHGKIVSAEITIGAEITLSDLTVRAVDWVIARVKGAKDRYAEGEKSLAWSNGDWSSSASNGDWSSSASNGDGSSSASNGDWSSSASNGDGSSSASKGDWSSSASKGDRSSSASKGAWSSSVSNGDWSSSVSNGDWSSSASNGDWSSSASNGYRSSSASNGDRSSSVSNGDWSSSASNGDGSSSVSNGDWSSSASNGDWSSSASNGYRSSSASNGAGSVAMSAGEEGRAKGEDGNAIFLVYRNPKTKLIEHAKAFIVGRDGIKPDTVYMLDAGGSAAVASE